MNEAMPVDSSKLEELPAITLRALALEVCLRSASAFLFFAFAYAAFTQWLADPTRVTLLLIVVAESLSVCLSLLTRVPTRRDWHPAAVLSSLGATFYFLGIKLAPGMQLIPEFVGAALQIAGIAWQIFAKLSLRRSFGLLPANRGIVTRGPYRLMRHPMYLGYFVAHVGFLWANFGLQNLLVFTGLYGLQVARIIREERLLSEDPQYRGYGTKVRYRVIPGIF